MRPLLVLGAATALFFGFLFVTHRRAVGLVASENAAVDRLRAAARSGGRAGFTEGGYRFRWVEGAGLPPLCIAEPLRHGETGVRWFATPDGLEVYEFDTVLFRSSGDRPEIQRLRSYLTLSAKQRESEPRPPGWTPVK
jgi:hypothetical protein